MERKLNYPVKYAVLELKTKGGFEQDYKDMTVGFIASKCYVIGQNVRYYQDGTSKLSYQVVFPYNDIHNYKWRVARNYQFDEKEISPSFGYYGDCMNANIVLNVFDTYDEASVVADSENENKKRKIGTHLSLLEADWKEKYDEQVKVFEENLALCKRYEQIIVAQTANMLVTGDDISVKQFVIKKEE